MKRELAIFVMLIAAAAATSIDYRTSSGGTPDWKFDTDLQFTSSFTLTSNGTTINNGGTVCSNSSLTLTPSVSSIFATGGFDTISGYPSCGGGYCPAMIPDATVTHNLHITWLSSSTWDDNYNFAVNLGNDFSQDPSRFSGLGGDGAFSTQTVTYTVTPGVYVAGQEGGAGVFCKGSLVVKDGVTTVNSAAMPTSAPVNFAVGSTGTHTISTSLSNVQCFGSILKHPEEESTHPEYFYFYYFAGNAPTISTTASNSITVNVQNNGGTCAMHETSVSAATSITSSSDVLVHVVMHNDGDAIMVSGVSSSNSGYSATAFPTGLCGVLGFPPSICPADNGFNESISPGGSKDLYVLVHNTGGASGGTTLTFSAQTVSSACGGASTCTAPVDITGAVTCAITPSSLSIGPLEVAQFGVSCADLADNPITCDGDSWSWGGLSGDFITKSNSGAEAYTTSPAGSSGTLNYQSDLAMCHSDITVIQPTYECAFVPPSATVPINTVKHFVLNCFVSGTPQAPDSATYDLINGLSGSTSGGTPTGVDYNAPGSNSNGNLRGFGQFGSAPSPILGAVALASIQVTGGNNTNNTNNSTGCTGPNCGPDGPGSTQWCTIGNGPLNVFPGFSGWLPIKCGASANETCGQGGFNVTWSSDPANSTVLSGNNLGVGFTITSPAGSSGTIIAVVNSNGTGCTKPFFVGSPTCAEES